MLKKLSLMLRLGLLLLVSATLLSGGCSTVKQWAGYGSDDADEETAPPEARQETVMIDGKPYVRSKNPYWLSQANAPEYLYVEKGTEFVGAQQMLLNSLAKAMGREQAKVAGKTIPPDNRAADTSTRSPNRSIKDSFFSIPHSVFGFRFSVFGFRKTKTRIHFLPQ